MIYTCHDFQQQFVTTASRAAPIYYSKAPYIFGQNGSGAPGTWSLVSVHMIQAVGSCHHYGVRKCTATAVQTTDSYVVRYHTSTVVETDLTTLYYVTKLRAAGRTTSIQYAHYVLPGTAVVPGIRCTAAVQGASLCGRPPPAALAQGKI